MIEVPYHLSVRQRERERDQEREKETKESGIEVRNKI